MTTDKSATPDVWQLYRTLAGPEDWERGERYLDMDMIYRVPSLRILIVSYDTTNLVFTRRVTCHSFAHVSRCILDVPVSVVGQMDGECSEAGWVNVRRALAKL